MSEIYNVYCDESCHLENDGQNAMVLGAIWCAKDQSREIAQKIRELKVKYNLSRYFEIKWTKVSNAKLDFYLDLVDYFFDCKDLHFRALLISNKSKLCHDDFSQSHDEWYYKMYFTMLKQIFNPHGKYLVYLDIKDTHGAQKINKLHDVLCSNIYDFSQEIIERVQLVHSHEVEQLQLCDLFIGSICYINRELASSEAKLRLIERLKYRSGYSLKLSTLVKEEKFNIFRWRPQEKIDE